MGTSTLAYLLYVTEVLHEYARESLAIDINDAPKYHGRRVSSGQMR